MKRKVVSDKQKIQLLTRPTIMIVDDDQALANALEALLRSMGYSVLKVANSVVETKQWLENRGKEEPTPEIIITDYHMNNENGAQLIQEVKKIVAGNKPRIILMSGAANEEEIAGAGADIFLRKPVGLGELTEALFNLVPHELHFEAAIKLPPQIATIHNQAIFKELTESHRKFADKVRHDMGNYLQQLSNIDILLLGFSTEEETLPGLKNGLSMITEMVEKLRIIFTKIETAETVIGEELYSRAKKNPNSMEDTLEIISAVQQEADNKKFIQFLVAFIKEIDRLNSELSQIVSNPSEGWINKGLEVRAQMFQLLNIWFPL